ncbi:hypothetical protein BDR03DRAFT_1092710 [Suillus americanus]|nr:hypothetical protein BDR03DRAFT_1092710 [Suillus americanus]
MDNMGARCVGLLSRATDAAAPNSLNPGPLSECLRQKSQHLKKRIEAKWSSTTNLPRDDNQPREGAKSLMARHPRPPSALKRKRLAEKAAKQSAKHSGTTSTSTPSDSVPASMSHTDTPPTSISAANSMCDLTSMVKLQIATDRWRRQDPSKKSAAALPHFEDIRKLPPPIIAFDEGALSYSGELEDYRYNN